MAPLPAERPAGDPSLTSGERRALDAYLQTGSVKAAAHRLGRSEQTIKNQLYTARKRLHVRNTAQLASLVAAEA